MDKSDHDILLIETIGKLLDDSADLHNKSRELVTKIHSLPIQNIINDQDLLPQAQATQYTCLQLNSLLTQLHDEVQNANLG